MDTTLQAELASEKQRAISLCKGAPSLPQLEELRVRYLGRKGWLTGFLKRIGELPAGERPAAGRLANEFKQELESAIQTRTGELGRDLGEERVRSERLDVTLPGRPYELGSRHPITMVQDDIRSIFGCMGFEVAEGPEVELDYYNFQALNIPKHHPARDMQATFFITEEILLRTQTSPVQIRVMEKRRPPVRIIAPGKVYRCDADVTHSPMFHQVEGLLVDRGVNLGHLKSVLATFARELFGRERGVRFRPSYFPFTEPSAEMDITCVICGGSGCRVCSHEGWLEILGAGMVHPRVLRGVGYDPEEVSGFAFGLGVERIAMLRYGIDDIRLFFENDMRFLSQFE